MPMYSSFVTRMINESLRGRNWKMALVTDFPVAQGMSVWADAQSYEVSGYGYPPGGKAASLSCTGFDDATGAVFIACAPIDFGGAISVGQVDAAVFYDDTGNPATSALLCADMFGAGFEADGVMFTYDTANNPTYPGPVLAALLITDDAIVEGFDDVS